MIKVYQTIECKNNLITTIAFKGVKVKVEFKGGNIMKGIHARLYTKDPFVQKALDESDQKGRMYRFLQELPEGDSGKGKEAVTQQPTQQQPVANASRVVAESAPKAADTVAEPEPGFPPPTVVEGDGSTQEGDGSTQEGAGQKFEFDNLADAITYIAATWGEQVENENQARKFIEEKTGVKPVIHKG